MKVACVFYEFNLIFSNVIRTSNVIHINKNYYEKELPYYFGNRFI